MAITDETGPAASGLATIASRHPAVGLAVGVIQDGRLSLFWGHGLAATTANAIRRHRRYAPLRARGRALAAAAATSTRSIEPR